MRLPQHGWLKVQLHSHSTRSDGRLEPQKVVDFYANAGFSVVSITDHNKITQVLHPHVLTPPGLEVAVRENGDEFHIVVIGAEELPPMAVRSSVSHVFEWCRDNDLYAFLAHPYWSMLNAGDLLNLKSCYGVEVYNHGCEVEISRGYSGHHWDYVLSKGLMLQGLAVDDSHTYTVDSLGGWLEVDAESLDPEAVIKALKSGHFYASSGVKVESFEWENGFVRIKTYGANVVKLLSGDTKGAYLSFNLLRKLANTEGLPLEVEYWEEGFRIKSREVTVEGKLRANLFVEVVMRGQIPARGYARLELVEGLCSAWLNPVKV